MPAASRLSLLLAALVAVFVLGISLALGGLLALHDPGAAVVFAVAALAGVLAATLTYLVARSSMAEPEEEPVEEQPLPIAQPATRASAVEALPVASLPAPYVAAVMKGLHANRQALERGLHPPHRQPGA
jgi:hypothetical protein